MAGFEVTPDIIVAKLEMGEREVTDLELTILAKALGVKVGDLFD